MVCVPVNKLLYVGIIIGTCSSFTFISIGLESFCVFLPRLLGFESSDVSLVDEYDSWNTRLVWANGFAYSSFNIFGIFAGAIVNRLGFSRTMMASGIVLFFGMLFVLLSTNMTQMYIALIVVLGFGQSMCVNATIVSLGYFHRDHYGVVLAITTAGLPFGKLASPILTEALIELFGVRGGYLLLSCLMMLNVCFVAVFCDVLHNRLESARTYVGSLTVFEEDGFTVVEKSKQDISCSTICIIQKLSSASEYTEMKKTTGMFSFITVLALGYGGYISVIPYISPHARSLGINQTAAEIGYYVNAISSLIGRGLLIACDVKELVTPMTMFFIGLSTNAFSHMVLAITYQYGWFLAAVMFDGMSSGCMVPYVAVILRQISGTKLLPMTYGWVMTCWGLFSFVLVFLYGHSYSVFGTYHEMFLICSAFQIIALLVILWATSLLELMPICPSKGINGLQQPDNSDIKSFTNQRILSK
ncbi:monocarboxylate transporter 4-like [Antedon mediterranea]|uniref:monocarboxylate transporter 4-like n=1 Tax=Antedon mediterranea TaxID=105859 RepID=UPI003AF96752